MPVPSENEDEMANILYTVLTLLPLGPGRPMLPGCPLIPMEPGGPGRPSSPGAPYKIDRNDVRVMYAFSGYHITHNVSRLAYAKTYVLSFPTFLSW